MRIEGAKRIRKYIEEHQLEAYFKVPQKWIYVIPKQYEKGKDYYLKYTILVEEDMELLPKNGNLKMWQSDQVTSHLLQEVYLIIKKLGLRDCAKPDNIPFSSDFRIAFIDTQTFGESSIPYQRLLPFLNTKNKKYGSILSTLRP